MNHSGFDRSKWPPRSKENHFRSAKEVSQARNKQEQRSLESSRGCRYSVLLKLPYFDACKMLIVDPMHNVFLGSGKHMLQLWNSNNLVKKEHYSCIQHCVSSFVVPSDVGRIPRKIDTGFSGFTVDQFKNWIAIYSIPALHGILPNNHLECWRHFVLASRLLCKQKLSESDILLIDALLIRFCTKVEQIYGCSAITPNMHMHGHLKDVLRDYGPVYNF